MNSTITKFGYPATLVGELEHWLILLRPVQVTFGSLVLAARSQETAFAALPPHAFIELHRAIEAMESVLLDFVSYERINYLMLMMVDPHVHFHVIPRYSEPRGWHGVVFPDAGWPAPPRLDCNVVLDGGQLSALAEELRSRFRSIPPH